MRRYADRPERLGAGGDRLPEELQDSLGFRFLSQLPAGPMRESVEGYLAMPLDKRGPNSLAHEIVVSAVRREQERLRAARAAAGRFFALAGVEFPEEGAAIAVTDPDRTIADEESPEELEGTGRVEERVRFEFAEREPLLRPSEPEPAAPEPVESVPAALSPAPVGATEDPGDPYLLEHAHRDLAADPQGWGTGFEELDACGLRFVPGRLYLVHGPPGGGRTAFLLELLRRYAERGDGAVFIPARASRGEMFARLLTQFAATHIGTDPLRSAPSGPTVREWLRDPESVPPEDAEILAAAAETLDGLAREGAVTLVRAPETAGAVNAWVAAMLDRAAASGPRLVLVDDALALSPATATEEGPGEQDLARVARRLRRIAAGRGGLGAVPVVFSAPVPPTGKVLPDLGGVLRVDDHPEGAGFLVSVEKNGLGPRGVSVEVRFPGPTLESAQDGGSSAH